MVIHNFDISIVNRLTLDLYKEILHEPINRKGKKTVLYFVSEDWYFWSHRRYLAEDAKSKGYTVYVLTRVSTFKEKIQSLGYPA